MSIQKEVFRGFGSEIFSFLSDLEKNNNIDWFHKNKERYQSVLVKPARLFVTELAPFFNRINPAIRTEPKFNQTLMRLNKDMRFAKGAPYKNYFLIHFGRFKMDSEFFLYFDPNDTDLGIFLNKSGGDNLYFAQNYKRYKKEIVRIFKENKLNNKFSLHHMDSKEPTKVLKRFNAEKHIDRLEDYNYILLQLNTFDKKKVATDNLLPLCVKIFSDLYPLLCFAYFPDPLKEIAKFKESFGVVV